MGARLGIFLPSSNTVVEPLAARMLAGTQTSAHFSRLGVVEVSLDSASLGQFERKKQVDAAQLLADAHVDCIVWGGTSASWLGPAHDLSLCALIEERTGIPSDSCVLAMNRRLDELRAKTIGLVSPYTDEVQARIIENYRALGYTCIDEIHCGGTISEEFAAIAPEKVAACVAQVAISRPDAILIMCTNMRGALAAEGALDKFDIPILDSAAETVVAACQLVEN